MPLKKLFCDLGEGTSLPVRQIVLILNAENATRSRTTREFIRRCRESGAEQTPRRDLRQANTLILANSHGKDALYISSRQAESLAEQC